MMEMGLFVGDTVRLSGITDEGKSFTRTLKASEYEPQKAEMIADLGAEVMEIDPATRYRFNIQSQEGVYVSKVEKGGFASKLGLSEGDVILAYGSYKVSNVKNLKQALKAEHDPKSLVIERGGGRYRLYRGF